MRARQRKNIQSETGQATVEFALTLVLILGLTVFMFQFALFSAVGSYFQYATFMSARAYLSAENDRTDQMTRAEAVVIQTLKGGEGAGGTDRWPAVARGMGEGNPRGAEIGATSYGSREGVRYSFQGRMFMLPFLGSTPNIGFELVSESFLGREPSAPDCYQVLEERNGVAYFDNGC
jgi:hypothetical protein